MVLSVGDVLPAVQSPTMDRMHLAYMTVAMRDPNLVHLEEDYAAKAGLPGVIAHGTFVVAYGGAVVSRVVGIDAIKHLRIDVTAPVFLGDVLTSRAEVSRVETDDEGDRAILTIEVTRQDGAQVGRGEAVVSQEV